MEIPRYIKISLLMCLALFFTLVVFNNMTDFESNWEFVQHVLSMDTTLQHRAMLWRAITHPTLQLLTYYLIIIWQLLTAILCWLGCFKLIMNLRNGQFDSAKKIAFLGLFCGFLLYMVGFIIIAGEWFTMWQSKQWNAEASAGFILNFILLTFLILQHRDDRI